MYATTIDEEENAVINGRYGIVIYSWHMEVVWVTPLSWDQPTVWASSGSYWVHLAPVPCLVTVFF